VPGERPISIQREIGRQHFREGLKMRNSVGSSILALATLLGGGIGGAQAQQPGPQSPGMTFFVTSAGPGKGADLGGLAGADSYCQQLAARAGAGNKTWHAYLSTAPGPNAPAINARDRIGSGPWQNFKGEVIARNVDDLHGPNNKLDALTGLTERGTRVPVGGFTPNYHDIMTGSTEDGHTYPANINMTCNNYTSSTVGKVMLGHLDRRGATDTPQSKSWNAAHQSRGCTQEDLISTGGNGLFYCFAQ
jgi:hypothetical protein